MKPYRFIQGQPPTTRYSLSSGFNTHSPLVPSTFLGPGESGRSEERGGREPKGDAVNLCWLAAVLQQVRPSLLLPLQLFHHGYFITAQALLILNWGLHSPKVISSGPQSQWHHITDEAMFGAWVGAHTTSWPESTDTVGKHFSEPHSQIPDTELSLRTW